MLSLAPIRSEKVWGYEDWIASTHADGCQTDFKREAGDYPLLVKVIQADDTLSVQVHPDDETAVRLEGAGQRGKTECWLVLDAKPDATLVYGLKKDYSPEELKAAIDEKRLEDCLNTVSVKKGDFIFIPAGTVHAIGGGLRLMEVQQSCNITYRLYDWGRPREIHVEKCLLCIKNDKRLPIAPLAPFTCDYFSLTPLEVSDSLTFSVEESSQKSESKSPWELIFISEGEGTISSQKKGAQSCFPFKKEAIFALEAGEQVSLTGKARVIRIATR